MKKINNILIILKEKYKNLNFEYVSPSYFININPAMIYIKNNNLNKKIKFEIDIKKSAKINAKKIIELIEKQNIL